MVSDMLYAGKTTGYRQFIRLKNQRESANIRQHTKRKEGCGGIQK